MKLTKLHADYWASRRAPRALRDLAQKVTIDQVVNANAGGLPGVKAHFGMATTITLMRRRTPAAAVDFVLDHAWPPQPGEGRKDEIFGYPRQDRRIASCRKWAAKILKGRKYAND